MQQPMVQFLANLGLYNLNIKCRNTVQIFHWLWNGRNFCMNLSQFELFFKEMDTYSLHGYQLVLLQLYPIDTVMLEGCNLNIVWNLLKNTNMLFFGNKIINIGDRHMKAAEFKGLSWLKHWAYVYTKNITKFCPPRWCRYLLWPMDYMYVAWFFFGIQTVENIISHISQERHKVYYT